MLFNIVILVGSSHDSDIYIYRIHHLLKTECSFLVKGSRKRPFDRKICSRAIGFGGFIYTSYLYRTDSAGKARK